MNDRQRINVLDLNFEKYDLFDFAEKVKYGMMLIFEPEMGLDPKTEKALGRVTEFNEKNKTVTWVPDSNITDDELSWYPETTPLKCVYMIPSTERTNVVRHLFFSGGRVRKN